MCMCEGSLWFTLSTRECHRTGTKSCWLSVCLSNNRGKLLSLPKLWQFLSPCFCTSFHIQFTFIIMPTGSRMLSIMHWIRYWFCVACHRVMQVVSHPRFNHQARELSLPWKRALGGREAKYIYMMVSSQVGSGELTSSSKSWEQRKGTQVVCGMGCLIWACSEVNFLSVV